MERQTLKSSPQRIALLDDDPDFGALMAQFVSDTGRFRPLDFHITGEHLMGSLSQKAPEIALIDIKLPGRSGLEWAREIKQRRPAVKIMFVTGFPDDANIRTALQLGASYLIKPFSRAELEQALLTVASGGVFLSSAVKDFLSPHADHDSDFADEQEPKAPARMENGPNQTTSDLAVSKRQREIIELLSDGLDDKQIAEALSISINTVRTHIRRLFKRYHCHRRTEMAVLFSKPKPQSRMSRDLSG